MRFIIILSLFSFPVFSIAQSTQKTSDILVTNKGKLQEVVITASKTKENILRSPVSIEKIDFTAFKSAAAPSFFDALENVKGVQMITPSLGFRIINTRGFANTTNVRFAQLVDGADNMAPHLGTPIGNAMGPSDLDIESVEIIFGTASALYGLNALNGLANFITKDPFTSQGISFQQKTGFNHFNNSQKNAQLYTESSLRIAHSLNRKLAFKLNGTFTQGYDWIADNHDDMNASANTNLGIPGGQTNPAYDPVNVYGNESSNRKTITLKGKQYAVARTGYAEKEVTDYDLRNIKTDVGLTYRLNYTRINYTYRFAILDNIYQRANRFRLKDYKLQQHAVELKNKVYQLQGYWTKENTGKSYNLRSAAENQDRNFKTDAAWYNDFTNGFNTAVQAGSEIPDALKQARTIADAGRYQSGTSAFNDKIKKLSAINNWDVGSALRVKDDLFHVEGQIDISEASDSKFFKKSGLSLLTGMDHRTYLIHPDGNYFVNPSIDHKLESFTYNKTGAFLQTGKDFLNKKLKISAVLRADRNDHFNLKFNQRVALVYSPITAQNIRLSYQNGYRFPSIFEGFSNVNSGGVKRIGGLRVVSNGVFENSYLRTSIDNFQAAVKNDFNQGIPLTQTIEQQKKLLIKNSYTYLQPEHINSFETGYKAIFFDNKLNADFDFYYNKYGNFIAQAEVNIPSTQNLDSIPKYLNDKAKQSRYRVWTNSKSTVYNFGGSSGLTYNINRSYTLSGNMSYAKLHRTTQDDALEDGFNTPKWIAHLSFTGINLNKIFGFNVSYKRQSGFYWQSFLVSGQVPAYGILDAQANCNLLKNKINLKVGGTNLTNRYYNSFLGGPAIGGFYYSSLTYSFLTNSQHKADFN